MTAIDPFSYNLANNFVGFNFAPLHAGNCNLSICDSNYCALYDIKPIVDAASLNVGRDWWEANVEPGH